MNNFSDTELVAISPGAHNTVQSPNSNQNWVSFLYSYVTLLAKLFLLSVATGGQ